MKKILGVILGLVALLVVAVIVLPGFVDWNDYKNTIQVQLKALTGRNVVIGGDIHITILPTPAVIANNVRLANVKGGSAADMVRLKSLEVRISLGPLLTGNLQVETVNLVDPIVELERLADGRVNWEFTPTRTETDGSASVSLPGLPANPLAGTGEAGAIRLDSFHIENGTIIYRDAISGSSERIEHLEARLSADSLSGPLDSVGSFDFRGTVLSYEVAVGKIINERTVPINMVFTAPPGGTKAEISGAIVELAKAPKFKGKVMASGKMLSDLLRAAGGMATVPGPLAQSFAVEGDIVVSAADLSVKGLSMSLGGLRADGDLTAAYGATPATFALKLAVPRVDLDALLALPEDHAAAVNASGQPSAASAPVPATTGSDATAPADEGFRLPETVNGTLELSAPTVTYRGGIIGDVRLNAELNAGEVTVSQLSAQLPGGSDLFTVGVFSADKGQPRFDGSVEARISDLRRVMAWLGIPVPDIPSDRLRKATFKGRVVADSSQVQGVNLDVVVDSSHISGGVTVALRSRPAFGASIVVDRLNLDAYLTPDGAALGDTNGTTTKGDATTGAVAKPAGSPADGFAVLKGLAQFDANLRLQVERLTYRRVPLGGLAFDGTLFAGNLEVRKLGVGDLAGASGTFSGNLNGLNGVPSLKGGHFDVRGLDIDRLTRQFETSAPVSTRDIGVIALTGGIEGSVLRPLVDVVAKAPEASLDVKGRLSVIPLEPLFAGDVKVQHADVQRLLRLAGIDYRPSGRLGGVGLAASVKADAKQVTLSQINGTVGPVSLGGALAADLTGPRPRITGDVKTGRIVVDPFLPPRRSAALREGDDATGPHPWVIPAAWSPSVAPVTNARRLWLAAATGGGHWSTDPLDLSALGTFDADLRLASEAIVYDGVALNGVAAEATVTEGVLRLGSLSGTLFGGALKGNAVVRSAPKPAVDGSVSLSGGDFGLAEQEMRGKRLATGDIAFRVTGNTTGRNVAEMVAGLKGDGSFEVKKVALTADSGKTSLGPISGLLAGLNEIAGLLGGGQRPDGLADVLGSFKIERGIAHSEDFQFVSTLGEGKAKGDIDLPNWRMKVDGDIQLSQNLFSQLLSGTTGLNLTLPFRIEGDLAEPNVVLDTGKLPGKALSIPGAILDKAGVGKLLRKLVPSTGK